MTSKKLTIEDILRSRNIIEKKRKKSFYSETLGGEIEIAEVPAEKVLKIINSADADEPLRADYELIYECCPIFHSKELHKQFEVNEPIEIIEKCFAQNIQEIDNLAKQIMNRYGFTADKVEQVKK